MCKVVDWSSAILHGLLNIILTMYICISFHKKLGLHFVCLAWTKLFVKANTWYFTNDLVKNIISQKAKCAFCQLAHLRINNFIKLQRMFVSY